MHAGIGAPGAEHGDALAAEAARSRFRAPPGSTARSAGAASRQSRCRNIRSSACSGARQYRPGRQREAAQKGGRIERRAAGALQAQRPEYALAAGDRQAVVEHGAGRRRPRPGGSASARKHADAARRGPRKRRRATDRRRAPAAPVRRPDGASRAGPPRGAISRRRSRPRCGCGRACKRAARKPVERFDASGGRRARRAARPSCPAVVLRRRSGSPAAAGSGRYRAPRPSA